MANDEHVDLVKRGATSIKQWREANHGAVLQLCEADLSKADLTGADLSEADLADADLTGADLAGADITGADITGAKFGGAVLVDANLAHRTLAGTDFSGADLSGADLTHAKLDKANLSCAHLSGARVADARLSDANLMGADLTDANFARAVLDRTDFSRATLAYTVLVDVDLSSSKGLNSVEHLAPSSLGIDTLYRSKGKLSAAFLRGCGVPDGLISYLPYLLGAQEAIQFASCFISYSHKDEEFCGHLHSRMRNEHLRVWFAAKDMRGGRKVHEQVDQAIQVHDKLLIVLSESSIKSRWVEREIRRARKREVTEKRRVLFPIRLVPFERLKDWELFDADTVTDMAQELREYFIPDFSNWEEDSSFESAFGSLLNDLRAAAED